MIIKTLLSQSEVSLSEVSKLLHINSNKIDKIITQLEKENILTKKNDKIMIK
jgi:DNA-binding IscR family transcriptional regulator